MAVVQVSPRLHRIFDEADFTVGAAAKSEVLSFGLHQKWIVWLETLDLVGTPTLTLKLFDVKPEGAAVPPAAGDKVQHGADIVRTTAGLTRTEFGNQGATPSLMSNKVEFTIAISGAGGSRFDTKVWVELVG